MLESRCSNLLLIGLVLLLGIQLTGLTCLDEWQVGPTAAHAEIADDSPSPDAPVLDDGCPCHVVFQSVSIPVPENLCPFTYDVGSGPTPYVPTLVVFLFHPPLTV